MSNYSDALFHFAITLARDQWPIRPTPDVFKAELGIRHTPTADDDEEQSHPSRVDGVLSDRPLGSTADWQRSNSR